MNQFRCIPVYNLPYTIQEHFEQVMEQHEFVELAIEQVEALLQSDELNVTSELAVLYALCRWIAVGAVITAWNIY